VIGVETLLCMMNIVNLKAVLQGHGRNLADNFVQIPFDLNIGCNFF
jgi:hypothetical protein